MTTKPILFNDEMVRAILDGRKTQTRRVKDKRVVLGDNLWVREAFFYEWSEEYPPEDMKECRIVYRASEPDYINDEMRAYSSQYKWTPSIFMPRWASRITLNVTSVRTELLQDISYTDIRAEGIKKEIDEVSLDMRRKFINLWDGINGRRGYAWAINPKVWVIEFKAES